MDRLLQGTDVPRDTTHAAWLVQAGVWRRMGPARRLRTALGLSDDLRRLTAAGIQQRHPAYTAEQVRWAMLRRSLGDDLFTKAYPLAPRLRP
jgi:hypothetical protein